MYTKDKQYLQTWFICLLFAFWFLIIPGIIGIILLVMQTIENKKIIKSISEITTQNNDLEEKNKTLNTTLSSLQQQLDSLGATEYYQVQNNINFINNDIEKNMFTLNTLKLEIERLQIENDKLEKQSITKTKKISRLNELYKSVSYTIDNFFNYTPTDAMLKLLPNDLDEVQSTTPSIMLKLHCMDIKDLRKAYKENDKQINIILTQYSKRYTTKANQAIYQLMVIALRAELQNILYNLKYEKLDKSIVDVRMITSKYLKIAADGNQNIAGTLTKFIGEIEYLFINSVKIEYNYYVKKEQAKQEQLAIRQKMREEAEERKLLAQQQKQIEKEEEKYINEINKIQDLLTSTSDDEKIAELNSRILALQSQLSDVIIKKDEITKLQNGKAGNVYIISNLGSFGENVFKIGMTRRINPQERIDELGSASLPFKFDVHSFIFSDNAVDLEKQLHTILKEKRVNKVNLRKEFFNTTIDELEKIVTDIQPTAEFNKTMLAEEFRQSLSSDGLYEIDDTIYYNDNEEDTEEDF